MNRLVAGGIVLALATHSCASQDRRAATTPEQDEVFALLDRFDQRDDSKLPFVRVATGWTYCEIGGPWQNTYRFGFLLQSNGHEFVVRLVDGNRLRLKNTPDDARECDRVGFAPADFRVFARDHAELLRHRQHDRYVAHFYRSPRSPVSPETQGLFLARTCARLAYETELRELWDALPEGWRSAPALMGSKGMAAFHFSQDLDARAWLDLGDPTLTWRDLLNRFEFLIENCTGRSRVDRWTAQRDALKAHIELPSQKPLAGALTNASVDNLIAGLADVCLPRESGGFDEWPVPPMDADSENPSAFDELVRRGPEVVPVLIPYLGDKRVTRSWFYCSRFGGWFEPVTLGDSVRRVLVTIVGAEADGDRQFDWQRWHDEVKEAGLHQHLLATVVKAEPSSAYVASTLLARFPDSQEAVLEMAASSEGERRGTLLACVVALQGKGQPPSQRLMQLLEEDAAKGDPATSLSAAESLLELRSASGCLALTARWAEEPSPNSREMDVLLRSGDLEVWQRIEKHIQGVNMRRALVTGLARLSRRDLVRRLEPDVARRIGEVLRRCLVPLLRDAEPVGDGVKVCLDEENVTLHSASIADLAATQLAAWWPQEYPFEACAVGSARKRQIEALIAGEPLAPPVGGVAGSSRVQEVGSRPKVTSVTFQHAERDWSDGSRQDLQALLDRTISAEELVAALIATSNRMVGHTVHLQLERAGGSAGFSMACSLRPPDPRVLQSPSDFRLQITVAGTELTSCGLSSGRLAASDFAGFHGEYLARIRRALSSRPDQGVEVSVTLFTGK